VGTLACCGGLSEVRPDCFECLSACVGGQGVSVIDFSPANNLLITGSRDCTIRGWNPYASEHPVMVLRGHETPVIFLCVNELKVRLTL